MKKRKILLSITICLFANFAYPQKGIEKYINSFPLNNQNIIKTYSLIFEGIDASKIEALQHVYNNDTNRLYCIEEEYDMITEKVISKYKTESLPKKCARINIDSLILIFYTTNECQEPDALRWKNLYLSIYNHNYELKSNILVHKEGEYDTKVACLINTQKGIIFRYTYNEKLKSKEFQLIKVIDKEPYLVNKEKILGNYSIDNLSSTLEKIGWKEKFWK